MQTFHGYPFKLMGHAHWTKLRFTSLRIESFDRRATEWDYLVSPASYATPLLRRDFRYDGKVLEVGYPRNDVLRSSAAPGIRRSVRQQLGIREGQTAVLYAPTFRDYLSTDDNSAPSVDFLDVERLMEELGDDFVLLMRGHAFNARASDVTHSGSNVIDVTRYPDVADLYLAADAAIADYSSLRFDFGITGKPMIFLVPDLDRYIEARGWLFDYEPTAPGPFAMGTDDVVASLQRLDEVELEHRDAYRRFQTDYLDLDDGGAAARLVDQVFATPSSR